jgi:TetR/AcrR family transcriptional repressor of nem operon
MGRPREFDETAVLDAAIACFWADGYETTSVRDLSVSMQMTSASLYNAFGDKLSLYRRALERYVELSVRERIGRLESTLPPLAAIRGFFDEVVERSVADPFHRGCMLINAALELAPRDAGIGALVAQELVQIEAFFRRSAAAAQANGTMTSLQTPDAVGRHLLSVLVGIRVLARVRPDRSLLEGAAAAALVQLGSPQP